MKNTTEIYKGYKITTTTEKVVVKSGNKIFGKYSSIESAKLSIDAWVRNIECGDRIDATPQGRSTNPNVIRK